MKSKKAQISIFIIIGILFVLLIAVLLFFRYRESVPVVYDKISEDPRVFLQSCLEDKIKENVNIIASHGGYFEEKDLSLDFEGSKIAYLCYTHNYYVRCINQESVLIQHLRREIENSINEDVDACFNEMEREFESDGYQVSLGGGFGLDVDLISRRVVLDIDRDVSVVRSESSSDYDEFEISVSSRFYDLAVVVGEIVSQEARFCNFEKGGFMLLYPEFEIDKFRTGEGTIVYTVEHKKSGEEFKFAVRGCVIPPGVR